jgi:hypothetical protein
VLDEKTFRALTDPIELKRADHLVKSHTWFKKLVNGTRYKVVEPVLPMDVLGISLYCLKWVR